MIKIIKILLVWCMTLFLFACGGNNEEETQQIKKTTAVEWTVPVSENIDTVIRSYKALLKNVNDETIKKQALIRLAVLETEKQDNIGMNASSRSSPPDYAKAIAVYQRYLALYPNEPTNDHVLYQLARAYESDGEIEKTIDILARIIQNFPQTSYHDEIIFRQGELQFQLSFFDLASESYAKIIAIGDKTHLYEKALYKNGWALYKDGKVETALDSFVSLLDKRLTNTKVSRVKDLTMKLSRIDRELLEDTLRVLSLVFSSVEDNTVIAQYFEKKGHRDYEYLVYEHLGRFLQSKERTKDAADIYGLFAQYNPTHIQTPVFKTRSINAYKQGRFIKLLLDAKKDFVLTYQNHQNSRIRLQTRKMVKKHVEDLAQYYHAKGQKTGKTSFYKEASKWYKIFIKAFPDNPKSSQMNFLLAEIYFENKEYAVAAKEYEKTAYEYPPHIRDSEAGYAALLAYRNHEGTLLGEEKKKWHLAAIDSAMRFSKRFPRNKKAPTILLKAATDLYEVDQIDKAARIARQLINVVPDSETEILRKAWTIVAHSAFQQNSFDRAEALYQQVLDYTPKYHESRNDITKRYAASIYKQGERAKEVSDFAAAASHFLRLGKLVPDSEYVSTALYDAATALLQSEQWALAIDTLEKFRDEYPNNEFTDQVPTKLAFAFMQVGNLKRAAIEFGNISYSTGDRKIRREALWKSAELFEQLDSKSDAISSFEDYIQRFPRPLEDAIEARHRIASIYKKDKNKSKYHEMLRAIVQAHEYGDDESTDRTKFLAANAEFSLAQVDYNKYDRIRLVSPLKRSLRQKKKAMKVALKRYKKTLTYGIAGVTTAANFQIAKIYYGFSQSLMSSQRPKGLNEEELEQYDILLEEQAFPFEEKSIEAHELNADRVQMGIFDQWVDKSYIELAKLFPARYSRSEKSEEVINVLF